MAQDRETRLIQQPIDIDRRTWFDQSLGVGLGGLLLAGLNGLSSEAIAAEQGASSNASGINLAKGVRRIITGHNAKGRSYIIKDDRITGGTFPSLYRATGQEPLGSAPADEAKAVRPTDAPQLEPALGGSSFHFVTLPPSPKGGKPGWHRTETLDYNILMGGELVLMLDEGETKLYPGDVVIQRNTMHAWRNDTTSPVFWVAVLVPMKLPKG